jgi:hypothetical protein
MSRSSKTTRTQPSANKAAAKRPAGPPACIAADRLPQLRYVEAEASASPADRHRANVAKVSGYLAQLRAKRLPLPASNKNPHRVSLMLFAEEAGVPVFAVFKKGLRKTVEAAGEKLGAAVRVHTAASTSPSLAQALSFALAERRRANILDGLPREHRFAELRSVFTRAAEGYRA